MRLLLLVVDDLTTMSGVEAVGLALGVLPLIIVAIEKYEKISDLIGTYRKYSKAVGRFSTELAVQRVIFQNECVLLLSQVVDDGRALHDMFNEPAHSLRTSLRNDSKLDQKLLQRVNERAHDSYEQIVALLQLIEHNLRQIYDETKGYRDSLGNEVRPERDSIIFKDWAQNVRRKVRFSFGKTSLKAKIDDLCRCNENFRALSHQVGQFKVFRRIPEQQDQNKLVEKNLEEVQKTRIASDSLCEALKALWTCNDHLEHSVNLRLSLELGGPASIPLSKIQFSVAVTNWSIERYNGTEKPVELFIESSTGSVSEKLDENASASRSNNSPPGFEHLSVNSLDAISHETFQQSTSAKKPTKGVHFADDFKQQSAQTDQSHEKLPLTDLCDGSSLCKHFHKAPEVNTASACLGYLSGFLVYRSQPTYHEFAGATSLSRILSQKQSHQILNSLDKWKLAGALAMAVLQYHSTPWLQETWMSNDILFFDKQPRGRMQSLESPHLQLLRRSKGKEPEGRSKFADPFIKNPTLFRLGMILLELEFEDSVEGIAERCNPNRAENEDPQASWARRLLIPKSRAGDRLGTDYGRIVRMCLDCDFGLGLLDCSLDDPRLQKAFYVQIVCQFQKLLPSWEKIYGLHIPAE